MRVATSAIAMVVSSTAVLNYSHVVHIRCLVQSVVELSHRRICSGQVNVRHNDPDPLLIQSQQVLLSRPSIHRSSPDSALAVMLQSPGTIRTPENLALDHLLQHHRKRFHHDRIHLLRSKRRRRLIHPRKLNIAELLCNQILASTPEHPISKRFHSPFFCTKFTHNAPVQTMHPRPEHIPQQRVVPCRST